MDELSWPDCSMRESGKFKDGIWPSKRKGFIRVLMVNWCCALSNHVTFSACKYLCHGAYPQDLVIGANN